MPIKILFVKKISIFQLTFICVFISLCLYFGIKLQFENKIDAGTSSDNSDAQMNSIRNLKDFSLTKPLLGNDLVKPSKQLNPIKKNLISLIEEEYRNGNLMQASLYLRDLQTGEWTSINEEMTYHPGSLIKVPMLMYYLKESERDSNILNKKLSLPNDIHGMPNQSFAKSAVEKGKAYSVRELLSLMACNSDNNATYLLNTNANIQGFQKVFSDLNLSIPDVHDPTYSITVRDYSIFLRVLYNATYLSPKNSEYALELLTQSSFKQGISKKIPSTISVARKFGEMNTENKRELHESGIIYCNNRPYLLTIMTKGSNALLQANAISDFSDLIFKFFCS